MFGMFFKFDKDIFSIQRSLNIQIFMLNSKLNSKLAGIILAILVLGSVYLIGKEYTLTQKEIEKVQRETVVLKTEIKEIAQGKVTYVIDKGEENISSYQVIPLKDSTVFSLLEELARINNFEVESKIYQGMGVFIESIAGIKNGTNNKYWQYWVNDELPMVAADKKEIKEGDRVEWRFAPFPF